MWIILISAHMYHCPYWIVKDTPAFCRRLTSTMPIALAGVNTPPCFTGESLSSSSCTTCQLSLSAAVTACYSHILVVYNSAGCVCATHLQGVLASVLHLPAVSKMTTDNHMHDTHTWASKHVRCCHEACACSQMHILQDQPALVGNAQPNCDDTACGNAQPNCQDTACWNAKFGTSKGIC